MFDFMKKKVETLKNVFRQIPCDVRETVSGFFMSSAVMAAALLALSFSAYGGAPAEKNERETLCAQVYGLEPYREQGTEEAPVLISCVSITELGSSEELNIELLARSIEETVGNESYAVRIAFGAVLLNRVRDSSFPDTLSGVLSAAELYPSTPIGTVSERSAHAARDAMLGVDPTVGALYMMRKNDGAYEDYKNRVTAVYGDFAFLK